ncbi:MAG: hypothetical protein JO166_07260 [Deltaproteobacteria bacterium]|nr:hypothetical protein [Deltaproteobacteria bacterium]
MALPEPANTDHAVEHRLAVILCADVVSYSRLMGIDEEGTLAALGAARRELIDPSFVGHRGRIVRTTGDGFLVEFPSVVDAVRCALQIQRSMPERELERAEDRRLRLRIGVHMGDVIADGDSIFGDGVAIAARLEGLAEPGGINVSGSVQDEIRDRLALVLEDRGEQPIAGVARAVRAYRIVLEGSPATGATPRKPSLPIPKAALAVLPFHVAASDPEVDFFRDSVGEDLITELSRARWFYVVARNSSFVYKDKPADAKQVARELGVSYLVEGSIRTAGPRVRIACQLVDAQSGQQLWANRFDGMMEDSFDLQDQICESVVGAVDPILRSAEIERVQRQMSSAPNPYDLWLQSLPLAFSSLPQDNDRAQQLLLKAFDMAPDFSPSQALLAWCRLHRYLLAPPDAADDERQATKKLARAAIKSAQDDPPSLALAASVLAAVTRDREAPLAAVERAMLINAKSAFVLSFDALTRCLCGDYDRAIVHAERALHLSPFDSVIGYAKLALALVYLLTERYEAATAQARNAIEGNPSFAFAHCLLATLAVRTGAFSEAAVAVRAALQASPTFGLRALRRLRFADVPSSQADLARLRAAGLPE